MKGICFAFLIFVLGCGKNVPDAIIDGNVGIHYINSNGNELFSNGSNGFNVDSVRLYLIKNGEKQLYYIAPTRTVILDDPYGYAVDSSTGRKYFEIAADKNIINDTCITLVHLKPGVEDTLKCSFFQPNSNPISYSINNVWYNGKLVTRIFDVVK